MVARTNRRPAAEDLHDARVGVGDLLEQVVLDALVDGAHAALAHPPEDRPLGLVAVAGRDAAVRLIRAVHAVRPGVEVPGQHHRAHRLVPDDLAELDGYALVQKAAALSPESQAELEFVSALMSREPLTATHLRRAASSAAAGSLLAQNLAHYGVP